MAFLTGATMHTSRISTWRIYTRRPVKALEPKRAAVGAMLLAVLFGQLTRRIPNSDGGLYAYARHEFGDFAGYLTGWCYWIQCWAGNAAIVSAWVFMSTPRCMTCPIERDPA